MKNKLSIRYVVELVITLLLILFIAVVLVRMFVHSRTETVYAKNLTEAVKISESLAELSTGIKDKQEFEKTAESLENVYSLTEDGDDIIIEMTIGGPDSRAYKAVVNWSEDQGDNGSFILNEIIVYDNGSDNELYKLNTGVYKNAE